MKHLKYFESIANIEYHIQIIKDIFQDVIDEYNMLSYDDVALSHGLYYVVKLEESKNAISYDENNKRIIVFFYARGDEFHESLSIARKDIEDDADRLKSMGYKMSWHNGKEFIHLIVDCSGA